MDSENKAFVFDTNFIIQNKKLDEVVKNLNENNYSVYVTQVAIDERIAQECVKQKGKYDKIETLSNDTKDFATISINIPYEEMEKIYRNGMQRKYSELFGENIIPYSQDAEMFSKILRRAFMKTPPFITSGTDKGFKDSLMWLSMLDFFKTNREDKIVFVSNDNGFRENMSFLCQEFNEITGKTIEIKDNGYYNKLLEAAESSMKCEDSEPLPDFTRMREEIEVTIESLRWDIGEDYYGNEQWYGTFTLQKEVDSRYMEVVFCGLKNTIKDHIFEKSIPAFRILDLDGRIVDKTNIPMENIEKVLHLYEDMLKKYPNYIQQFYAAAAAIINRSYETPPLETDDDDLPF